jgi:AraC family transcriptional regulator, glycine betaine-responsive activator
MPAPVRDPGPQHFVFALTQDFTQLAFACAVEPLRIANLVSGRQLYRWSFASADGATATASNGSVTLVHHRFDALPPYDRLFVISGLDVQKQDHRALVRVLRKEARTRTAHVGALCSGAWVLAEAGLLEGHRAAIHWDYHDAFAEAFPGVTLVRGVFVSDDTFVTASGGTATADLMLHLLEQDHGYDLSVAVADQMVYSTVRSESALQRISLQSRKGIRNEHLARAVEIMRTTLDAPVPPAAIAGRLGISVRQLERLFRDNLGLTPKQQYTEMRLERARSLLLQTEMSVTEVAVATGFESAGHFARVYRQAYGITPREQRARLT